MKKNIVSYLLLLSFLVPFGAVARKKHHKALRNNVVEMVNDTVVEIDKPGKVVILESAEGIVVSDGNPGSKPFYQKRYPNDASRVATRSYYSKNNCTASCKGFSVTFDENKEKNSSWSISSGGLGFGLNGALGQPEGTGLQMGKSFDITWIKALAAEYKFGQNEISFGLGFDWKNFKMTGAPLRMCHPEAGGIASIPYPEGTIPLNSTLKIFSLGIPVLYSINVPSIYTKFSVGPVLNFNTYSSLKTSYLNSEGNKTTEFVKQLDQRKVSLDLFGSVTWAGCGLYLRYSPIKAMKSCSEINFTPLTVGIIFFM